jgi:hypothetical protein
MNEETAYLLAGSFVGFLIEKHGLPAFRRLYGSGNYEIVYGKALLLVETDWRSHLQEK